MKTFFRLVAACIISAASAQAASAQASFGSATPMLHDWKFCLTDSTIPARTESPDWATQGFDDSSWRTLDIPHDWSIELNASPEFFSCTGYYPGGIGWYRKEFTLNRDALPRQFIYFEGIYNRSEVYLNGHLLGKRPNGYVSFAYDLTPYLNPPGTPNTLAVRVDHSRQADSRWYTGSGIYRNVYLIGARDARFDLWGLGWSADKISNRSAEITIDASVINDSPSQGKLTLSAAILDAQGRVAAKGSGPAKAGTRNELKIKLRNPHLWDINDPYLYSIHAVLRLNGVPVDSATVPLGVRSLQFDPNTGFALNGRKIKVKGVCLHHDAGAFGAAVPDAIWRTRLENLKALGANAIRMTHNIQAPAVYNLCDSLGLLVMDENSDEWEYPKRKWLKGWNVGQPGFEGSADFFREWIDRDVTDMVRRNRCHPSIFMWSVGNEVDYPNDPYSHPVLDGNNADMTQPVYGGYNPEAPRAERIGEIAQRLAGDIRAIDRSRPVTGALAGVVMSNETAYPGAVDVVGYNYTESRYPIDHAKYPHRIIYGSENRHGYTDWLAVKNNPYIFGQFLWTGADYLGESGSWPSRGLGTGLLGFDNLPKPLGKFRAGLWSEAPVAYLGTIPNNHGEVPEWALPYAPDVWNYEDGETCRVICYTNSSLARLRLNGRDLGTATRNDSTGVICWDIPFEAGALAVEALSPDGKIIATDTLTSSGAPAALRATLLHRHGGIAQILVEVTDSNGNVAKLADNMISCHIEHSSDGKHGTRHRNHRQASADGKVRLLAIETSDNSDMSNHRDNRERAYRGRVVAYFAVTPDASPAEIIFSSPLLRSARITIEP